jgi:predicted nucleic acid-binding protein
MLMGRQRLLVGDLVICDVVAAEFFAVLLNEEKFRESLSALGLAFSATSLESAQLAGSIFKQYRREGGPREHLIPDFLIGAHAQTEANRIAADPHSTAADLMGAALVLSDMQPNYYMSRSLPDPASVGYLMWATKLPAIDVHWREGYRTMLLRARELAREATNREPDRVDWWRLSALVEFSGANRWEEWIDFSMDQKRLETSAEHDYRE